MKTRRLGNIEVSAVGMGCMGFTHAYGYTGLQGGSIMKGWMAKENEMIACCSDGTRPVIFKIERIDEE